MIALGLGSGKPAGDSTETEVQHIKQAEFVDFQQHICLSGNISAG